tara:strand:+ start:92 stop:379 length:288 start_codon:yes stop_codon:yes gene_type:complete
MTIVGKSVQSRRAMNSVIGEINKLSADWYARSFADEICDMNDNPDIYWQEIESGMPECAEDIFRFHAERKQDGGWVFRGAFGFGNDAIKGALDTL